ncbi:hypothetical protein HW555_013594 [Spodoptera exigua]|uniref:Uncharacterized protein n=1 Tax=Spodoptera exigua TaxID=7107 RepID=A0A835G331_SPOEX|nr:hypothetical protein HW555_013594 [Spodoptera exigua]
MFWSESWLEPVGEGDPDDGGGGGVVDHCCGGGGLAVVYPEHAGVEYIYLATGCSFADLHYGYRLGKSTIIKIVEQSGLSMSHMAGRFWISSINKSVSKCSVSIFGEICVHSTQKRAFKCTTKWRLMYLEARG